MASDSRKQEEWSIVLPIKDKSRSETVNLIFPEYCARYLMTNYGNTGTLQVIKKEPKFRRAKRQGPGKKGRGWWLNEKNRDMTATVFSKEHQKSFVIVEVSQTSENNNNKKQKYY
jgi:hypothetical protein